MLSCFDFSFVAWAAIEFIGKEPQSVSIGVWLVMNFVRQAVSVLECLHILSHKLP